MEIEKELSKKDAISFLRQISDALENNKTITIAEQPVTISKTAEIFLEYEEGERTQSWKSNSIGQTLNMLQQASSWFL